MLEAFGHLRMVNGMAWPVLSASGPRALATHSHVGTQLPPPTCVTGSAFLQDEPGFWLLCLLCSRAGVLGINVSFLPFLSLAL